MQALYNDAIQDIQNIHISPLDRGFLFGDGLYEVMLIKGKHIEEIHPHVDRLFNGLQALGITQPCSKTELMHRLHTLVGTWQEPLGVLYVQVTRGVWPVRVHSYHQIEPKPTLFAFIQSHPDPTGHYRQGVSAVTVPDQRGTLCMYKTTAILANTLAKTHATKMGAYEAINIHEGFVTEGSSSNVFVCLGDTLLTPPTGPKVLPGAMRETVIKWAKSSNIPVFEQPIGEKALYRADEIWITGSIHRVLPVTKLNNKIISNGPGPMWQQCFDELLSEKVAV